MPAIGLPAGGRDLVAHMVATVRHRHFIIASIRGDFQARFVRSRLGGLWHILNPLAQAAIFAFVLSEILAARLGHNASKSAYAVHLIAGLAVWSLFQEIVLRAMGMFVEFANAMKKIAFPRFALPVIVWGGALLNHSLLLAAIVVVAAILGYRPSATWLAIPLGAAVVSMLALALGVILGVFNVFARDVSQVAGVGLQMWFWATPIVYPASALPAGLQWLVAWNPLSPLVAVYQNALLHDRWHGVAALGLPVALSVVVGAAALVVFRRASPELVDAL